MKTTRTLIILDGWGIRKSSEFNAIAAANTPVWDRLLADYPNSRIVTSGMAVGLPAGQMGNSEVGHMNLGAGRTVYQHFTRINKAVQDGSFVANRTLQHLMLGVAERGGALHVLGLLSEGGVHSHASHIEAVCAMAASQGLKRVYVHAFLDGRDTPPRDSSRSISNLECMLKARGCGRLVSIIGRYYAMDRDQRWERTEKAWRLIVEGQGERQFPDGMTALRAAYACGEDDEFVAPTVIAAAGEKPVTIAPDDSAVFMNFRPDRARQLVHSLIDTQFEEFPRLTAIAPNRLVTLTPYSDDVPCKAAFIAESLRNGLGEYLANTGRTQLRIAETEKYAHVTFFFNGGREKPFAGESRILVPSPNVASYDLQPEISAVAIMTLSCAISPTATWSVIPVASRRQ
jgi:2,3-bisphosphoglycerate-independent phosphoglycerate mutase